MTMKQQSAKATHQHAKSDALRYIPVRNRVVRWQVKEDNNVLLEYPLPMRPLFKSILQRFSKKPVVEPTKKLELDGMGSQVWQLLDGKRDTKAIIKSFANHHSVSLHEAEQSVTAFFRELGKRGLISLEEPLQG